MDLTSSNKSKGKNKKKLPSYIKLNEKKVKSEQVKKNKNYLKMKKKGIKKIRESTGRIYIGNIPHGFYEDEMTAYFNQFGKVLVAYVARSKKTGRSRGYGYVEFRDEDVAKIAAETMNNYLMYNKILKCRYIPPEERKTRLRPQTTILHEFPRQKNRKSTVKIKNASFNKLTDSSYSRKVEKKMKTFQKFFTDRGIDFTYQMNTVKSDTVEDNISNKPVKGSESEASSEDDSDNQIGVLEIDESDTEIHFQTPPNVKKVIKKSTNTSASPQGKLKKEDKLKNKKKLCLMNDRNISKVFVQKDAKKEKKPLSKSQNIKQKLQQKKAALKEGRSSKMISQIKKNPNVKVGVMKSHVNKLSESNKTNSNLSKSSKENKSKKMKMKSNRLVDDKNSKKPLKRKS